MPDKNFIWLLLLPFPFFGQQKHDTIPKGELLKEVTISTYHINDSLLNAPAAIGILSAKDLQANNSTDISTIVNRIPGVYMQSANLTTNRISIRGIGARTPYGTNKIRAFYGSIPLTSGNSETIIEDIDLENIGQMEIIKGPLSSLYGAGLGGAILITPKTGTGNPSAGISTTHGSFGLHKNTFSYSTPALNISYHNLRTDGWRENSSYNREGITLGGALFQGKRGKLNYLFNHTYLKAFIPSSINKETFDNHPAAGAPTWVASKGFKQYKSVLGGISYDFEFNSHLKNATSVFINYKDNNEPRPFDVLRQYSAAYGARTAFTGSFLLGKTKGYFNFGMEYFRDDYTGKTLENRYLDNNGQGSLEGNKLTQNHQERNFYNAFAQLRLVFSEYLELQTGINFNKTNFELGTSFPAEEALTESYGYDAIWSPQLSLLFKPDRYKTIYLSASRGFSLPSVEETLTASGTINSNIKPESGYNFEIGGKFYFLDKKLHAEFSAYHMQINDLLVARRIGDDQYVGVNAGKTLHQGIELSADYSLNLNKSLRLNPFLSTSIGHYEFQEFLDNSNDFSGNQLTGVPSTTLNAGMLLSSTTGLYFSADYQWADRIPLNDANTAYSDSYKIINIKAGYQFKLFDGLVSKLAVGINNLFNEKYASMVLVNATASGNATPRYYYPGLPANYYANLSLEYGF